MVVDAEFRLISDRREGLLMAIGQVLIDHGFVMRRQRLTPGGAGAVLVMGVRGPQEKLLHVQEGVVTHPLVRSFEMEVLDAVVAPAAAVVAVSAPTALPPRTPVPTAAPPNAAPANPAPPAAVAAAQPAPEARIDHERAEVALAKIAGAYPHVAGQLRTLESALAPEQYEATMRYVGQRVGAWVYKRDFALGGKLSLSHAIRRIVLPAMRQVVKAELREDVLYVADSPFCHRGQPGQCCHFLRGMVTGLLGSQEDADRLIVTETRCRNTGADACCFTVGP